MRQQDFINVMLGAVLEVFGQALIFEGTNARTTAYPAPQRNRAAEHWLIGCLTIKYERPVVERTRTPHPRRHGRA